MLLNKITLNVAAAIVKTNSKIGRQYAKCKADKLCNEVYLCDTIVTCKDCKKIKAL
jgi:hypothetical protein